MNNWYLLILAFLVALITTAILTPKVIKLAYKIGIIDDPKLNKHPKVIHTYPVPRGGGIPLAAGIVLASFLFLPLDKHLVGILLGIGILVIMGVIDDKYDISPYKRLLVQFVVAAVPIAAGIGISFVKFPLIADFISNIPLLDTYLNIDNARGIIDLSHPRVNFELWGQHSIWILSDLFALIWIVLLMNFINMGASGLDGQLSGTTGIAALTIALLSLKYSADITEWPVAILAIITAGAYFGFLIWHKYPQRIMPGFGGSTLAGFMLGILSILSTTKVGTLLVVLAVPLIDTGYTIVRRMLQGKAPLWGDRGHLHHKLLDMGYSKQQVAFFYWATTALLGILALNLNAESKLYTILGVGIFLGGFLLFVTKKNKIKTNA